MRDIKDVSKAKIWSATVDKNPRIHYELARPPVTVPSIRVDVDKPVVPKKGVGLCEFSCTGRYLASKNENMPNVLWIWDLTTLSQVALIQQLSAIRSVAWNPVRPGVCAISCGNNYVYLWAADEDTKIENNDRQDELAGACSAIEVPAVNFQIAAFSWCPDGRSLVLIDKDKFCIAYLVEEM
ncbi:hypothetical protein CcCBS67573_g10611 [Chytriomyces confervae]|uniref:Anaphase-promoting complex subunit 4 WD40 domain-containing protein n=1 Tax=Chytriomyces confervae TaxID=246404 RepID=A0A507CNG7_9FUNG|nr:hypothetical protein CcCBS67573_g10611 [Chytriomyces confervae]